MCDFMRLFRPWLLRVLFTIAVVWIAFVSVVWWAMRQPPEVFGQVMARMPVPAVFILAPFETLWTQARAGTLHLGDAAPDFSLLKLDKSDRVQLSSLTAREPVVLVFGSYT